MSNKVDPLSISDPCCFPLGFMYVSSYIKSRYYFNVKVLNYNLWIYDLEEELKGQDHIYLTGSDEFFEFNSNASQLAHDMGLKVFWGGSLATHNPDMVTPYADVICQGEIDANIPIDRIHWPDYEAFGIDEYHNRHSRKYMGVLTSRNCPYACSFCSSVGKYRERNIRGVEAEIRFYIKKYGIDLIIFNDNTLNVTKPRFIQICDMMRRLKIGWTAAIRADVFDAEMALAAKKSGCEYFVVGVESFRQNKLDMMNKNLKVASLVNTLNILHKFNIKYHGNILLGFKNETIQDIADEVGEIPVEYNVFPMLVQPYLGTKARSSLSLQESQYLGGLFTKYATDKGMKVNIV